MKIAVLGTGKVGSVLGGRWASKGHSVVFGSRDPHSEKTLAAMRKIGGDARAVSWRDAAAGAEVLLLAMPWTAVAGVLAAVGDVAGKVIIDCINPINAEFTGLDLGHTTSAAEQIAELARGAHVVKAFNVVSATTMANPRYGGEPATLFFCGDDSRAKTIVKQLAEELDFEGVDAGPLRNARYLEPLAMLYIHLAVKQGWGSNCAFKIVRR